MEAYLTWKYFVVSQDNFGQIKEMAEELDELRNRELDRKDATKKEALIDFIDEKASRIADRVIVYHDDEINKDGTITEELVYRMDDAKELRQYKDLDQPYFHFLVYITPEDLQARFERIDSIFKLTADHHLLKTEFLGKWVYLERAREIFKEIWDMYKSAFEQKCGIIKIDKVKWIFDEEEEEETEEVTADTIEA